MANLLRFVAREIPGLSLELDNIYWALPAAIPSMKPFMALACIILLAFFFVIQREGR